MSALKVNNKIVYTKWIVLDTPFFSLYLNSVGGVAQLGEHLNGIQGVRGSNPLTSKKRPLHEVHVEVFLFFRSENHMFPYNSKN
jgi:hypothetical protein